MATYLFAWNPRLWPWPELGRLRVQCRRRGFVQFEWSSGRTRRIEPGSRAFMIRLGVPPKGIVGAGVVKHNAIEVEGDGFFPDVTLDGSVGPTLEIGWKALALTYTSMKYTAPTNESFDASAFGLSARWVWQSRRR